MRHKPKPFNLKKYKKDMTDFNKRFPPVKGMMYNLNRTSETVPGFVPKKENE